MPLQWQILAYGSSQVGSEAQQPGLPHLLPADLAPSHPKKARRSTAEEAGPELQIRTSGTASPPYPSCFSESEESTEAAWWVVRWGDRCRVWGTPHQFNTPHNLMPAFQLASLWAGPSWSLRKNISTSHKCHCYHVLFSPRRTGHGSNGTLGLFAWPVRPENFEHRATWVPRNLWTLCSVSSLAISCSYDSHHFSRKKWSSMHLNVLLGETFQSMETIHCHQLIRLLLRAELHRQI